MNKHNSNCACEDCIGEQPPKEGIMETAFPDAKATKGEEYTMQEIFRENIKYFSGQSKDAEEIVEESR